MKNNGANEVVDSIVRNILDGKICLSDYEETEKNIILTMKNTYGMFTKEMREYEKLKIDILEREKKINTLQNQLDCLLSIIISFFDKNDEKTKNED